MRLHNGVAAPQDAERPDLGDVLRHYGADIYQSGMFPCEFHEDTRPSMSVNLEQGLWNCFACNKGGDVWTAIQEKEGTDFEGALRFAEETGFDASAPAAVVPDATPFGRARPGGRSSRGVGHRDRSWQRPW